MTRRQNETIEEYHKRLKLEKRKLREKLWGRLIWDSKKRGTYRRGSLPLPDDDREEEN